MNNIFLYKVTQEILYLSKQGSYNTYGLQVMQKTETSWKPTGFIHDITADFPLAQEIAELLTLYQLYPVHVQDVIQDILYKKCFLEV